MARKPSLLERLRAKKQPKAMPVLAVVWYENAEEWAKAKAAATDPDTFEASYEDWKGMAEAALAKFAERGLPLQKVMVQAGELAAWCRRHNKPCDSGTRAQYVSELSQARAKADKP